MQVCGQVYGCREDTLLVLALALAVKLFPPFRYIVKARLVICQHFHCLSLTEQDIPDCCILHRIILCKIIFQSCFSSCCRAFHQFIDISAAHSDRKQSYCSKH